MAVSAVHLQELNIRIAQICEAFEFAQLPDFPPLSLRSHSPSLHRSLGTAQALPASSASFIVFSLLSELTIKPT